MCRLKYTILWLVFLLVHLQLEKMYCAPLTKKTCPIFPPPAECLPEPDDECNNDEYCSLLHPGLGLKCCKNPCNERICVPPVVMKIDTKTDISGTKKQTTPSPTTKLSKCPIFPPPAECSPEPDDECNNDEKCSVLHPGLGLKCCIDGCDRRCVSPVVMKIDTKTDISGTKQQTTPLPKTKLSKCPIPPLACACAPEPDDECDNDEKCSELHPGLGLKCCVYGCDKMCVPPVVMKIDTKTDISGTKQQTTTSPTTKLSKCPIFPPPAECPPEPDDECNNDEKCSVLHPGLGLKCCIDGCDRRCVSPVVRKIAK